MASRSYILKRGYSRLSDLADGALAGSGLAGTIGNVYWVDPTNGKAGASADSPENAESSLLNAYNKCTSGQNDVVFFIGGATAYSPSAAFTWSKSYTHLIGISAPISMGQRCRITNTAANDLAILFTLSGSGCVFKNLQFFDGKDSAADGACLLVSGSRNYFENVFVAGMGDATASGPATRSGSYGLSVTGAENTFFSCHIGLDTIERTAANSELIVSGVRNSFVACRFECNSTTAGKFLVKIDNAGGDLRWTEFDSCAFYNYTTNWATGITNAFSMPSGGSTHDVILRGDNYFHKGMTVADNLTRIYSAAPVPNAGFGIAVNPTT